MAYPSDLARTKDWGAEVLTDADIEGQLDLIINWVMAFGNSTTGHKHDATQNEGPKIKTGGLDLSTITQNLVMTSKILKLAKGADVASAAGNIALGDDGNYFDITGVLAITSITIKAAGTKVTLQFDSTASLVDGGNLKLNRDFQGAAESQITLISDGTNWFEVSRQTSAVGRIVQVVNVMTGAYATGNTQIPNDDTIPQITEGDEYMTLAITPKSASNKLLIEVVWCGTHSAPNHIYAALFNTDTHATNALAVAGIGGTTDSSAMLEISFKHYMTSPGTGTYTFRVRAGGPGVAQALYFNGHTAGRIFGGVSASSITITEIEA